MKIKKSIVYTLSFIFVFVSIFAGTAFAPDKSVSASALNYYRGVNLAGPGFSSGTYWINQDMINYYAGKGFDIFRISILWERIQPTLGGSLDATYLQGLKDQIARINNAGKKAIIDLHNYCRYNGVVIDSSNEVTSADFADVWAKLASEFKSNSAVYAYDIMNEPNGIDIAVWKTASQAAVSAIRGNSDDTLLIIEGVNYSHPEYWESYNATTNGWINDPSNNTMYSAHVYFDYDGSGTYKKTYDDELAANPELNMIGVKRIHDFLVWCSKNNARGFIGEFGIPKDDERWNPVLENFMDALDQYGMDATYWAAGAWSTSYNLNLNPVNGVDSKPMSVLVNHLSGSIASIPLPPLAFVVVVIVWDLFVAFTFRLSAS